MPYADPEKRKQYNKEYREKNKEIIREQRKQFRENNKEKIAERGKKYYENNKEKIAERGKKYRENNKEKIKENYYDNRDKWLEYYKSDVGVKTRRISKWKSRGVVSDDWNALYEYYINCKNCEECDCELVEGMYGNNRKCLDHDHETGLFRNVLCHKCNINRK